MVSSLPTGVSIRYYLDLIFDHCEVLNTDTLVQRFLSAGAVLRTHGCDSARKQFADLECPDLSPYLITVFEAESQNLRGNWVHVMLSWGESVDSVKVILANMLQLSRLVGCWVYYCQAKRSVTHEDLDSVVVQFSKTARHIRCLMS